MNSLGHTARGLFVSCAVLAIVVAATLAIVRRWPLATPVSTDPATIAEGHAGVSELTLEQLDEHIRVALTRRPVRSVELRIDGPYRIVTLDKSRTLEAVSTGLDDTRVFARDGGITLDDRIPVAGGMAIVPEQSPGFWIDGRQYRGFLRLHATADDRVWPVNVLLREEYLAAVVDSEMPAAFPAAAREAQAIVARSYAVSCQQHPPHRWFDLYATPVSQNYLGVVYRDSSGRLLAGETPAGRSAAESTAGIVCTCDGRLFRTYYSACCGGRTLSGNAVFRDDTTALKSVACDACTAAPLFRWQRSTADGDALTRLARTRHSSFGSVESATTLESDEGTRTVAVSDGRRTVRLTAMEVKSALDLPSLMFNLTGNERGLTIDGRGHGHGVGLCQWGAKGLAERGAIAEQILQHYYPGSRLTRLP